MDEINNFVVLKWTGRQDLGKRLHEMAGLLGQKKAQAALNNASLRALKPMRDAIIRNAPYDPTPDGVHIKENIIVRKSKKSTQGRTVTQVTMRWRARQYKDTKANRRKRRVGKNWRDEGFLFYAKFQEFGLPSRNIPALGFFRRGFHQCKNKVQPLFSESLGGYIKRYLGKYKK